MTTGQCSDIMLSNVHMGEYQGFLRVKYGAFYGFEQIADLDVHFV